MKQHNMNNSRFMLLSLLFLCLGWGSVFAQTISITGKVIAAEDKQGLPGVTIVVKGTSTATTTDFDGNYKIEAMQGSILLFSYVGYKPQEVTVDAATTIDITLQSDTKLDDVVVVGYGTQIKTDVTGAIAQVKGAVLQNVATPSFDAGLQGRAVGLQVVQSSGVPGSAVRMRVRGQASLSGDSEPLYVVDGVIITTGDLSKRDGGGTSPVNGNALADLNPNDIESIDVLKDAAASAIYGSRGANGVVIITTKRGKAGKTNFSAGYYAGTTEVTRRLEFLNSTEWLQIMDEAHRNSFGLSMPANYQLGRGLTPALVLQRGTNTNWIDQLIRQGTVQEANVSASGGNEKTRFYAGSTYRAEEGFLKGNSFERFNARLNVDNQATDKLNLSFQFGLTHTRNKQAPNSFGTAQSSALPIFPIYNPDGSFFGSTQEQGFGTGINPVAQLQNRNQTTGLRILANINAEYKINQDFTFRTTFGFDFFNQFDLIRVSPANRLIFPADFTPVSSGGAAINLPPIFAGSFEERRLNVYNWTTNHVLSYNKTLNEKHNISAILGFEAQRSAGRITGAFTNGNTGFIDPYFDNAISGLAIFDRGLINGYPVMGGYNADIDNVFAFTSFFGRVNYKLSDKYLAGVSLRSDGSSRFGKNKRYGFFPAVSAGWIASEEEFLKGIDWLSTLKVRASWGLTGNANIPNFQFVSTYGQTGGFLGLSGLAAQRFANPNLSWERNRQIDFGIDFGVLKGRIEGSIGLYDKMAQDLLFFFPIQSSTGFAGVLQNTPIKIRNRGVEFNVTSRNLVGDLKWTTDFNIANNQNRVISTAGLEPDVFAPGLGESRVVEGKPVGIGMMMQTGGVDRQTGRELFVNPLDNTLVPYGPGGIGVEQATRGNDWRKPFGRPFPIFFGGINNTFSYKGFELSVLFTFSYGNTIYDNEAKFQIGSVHDNNQRRAILNRWQSPENPGDGKTPAVFLPPTIGSGRQLNSDRWLYDGSFLRLRTLMLSYTLPKDVISKAGLTNARVFISAQNLLLFTRFPGWDPEFANVANVGFSPDRAFQPFGSFGSLSQFQQGNLNFNVAQNPFPQTRSFTAGININF